jgi:hypothetical protein
MRFRSAQPRCTPLFFTALVFAFAAPSWGQARSLGSVPDSAGSAEPEPLIYVGGRPITGPFLPDTTVLARVNDTAIRVRAYVAGYFSSIESRPSPDSAGRVEFLNTMINKEVLAHVARAVNKPLSFEDRHLMREHTQRTLSNVLFQRTVIDSVRVPAETEIRKVYEQMRRELHLQRMLFSDRAQAERVRADLMRHKIAWTDAVNRYADVTSAVKTDGGPRWVNRMALPPRSARVLFDLEPGAVSPILGEDLGYAVYQVVERREVRPPAWEAIRGSIRQELRALEADEYREKMLAAMRQRIGMTHDTTNIRWAAAQFAAPVTTTPGERGPTIEINEALPEFSPADTARVLARYPGGTFTLGKFVELYGAMPAMMRSSVNTAEAFRVQVDIFVLEPTTGEIAGERGLDRDSMAVAMIEKRREELLVDHLYSDSILARVQLNPSLRRKYYEQNTAKFMTYPKVRYASFHLESRLEADSLAAGLRAGLKAEAVLRADSLAGRQRGLIEERSQQDHGSPHHKLLFEELRPGQVSVQGPDRQGHCDVLQSLAFDAGRQLSFEEGKRYIDDTLRNQESEKLLKAFLQRHRRRIKIEAHPELVMQIRLVDSTP